MRSITVFASRSLFGIALIAMMLIGLAACTDTGGDPASGDALTVVATVPPMGWLVEQVGGEHVDVVVLVDPGQDPHTYEPTPGNMRSMGDADAYVTVDLEFEDAWLPRFQEINPEMTVIDAAAEIERLESPESGGEADPHVWTSPTATSLMALEIAEQLGTLDPDNADDYEINARTLDAEIAELDSTIAATLDDAQSTTFMVYHPAWGYFAREYGLEQLAVESGGQEPSAAELAELIELARSENITVIFVQPSTNTRTADLIAEEIGADVVVVNPLAEDWLVNMQQVAAAFEEALN